MGVFWGEGEWYISVGGKIVRIEEWHKPSASQSVALLVPNVKSLAMSLIWCSTLPELRKTLLKAKIESLSLLYSQYLEAVIANNSEEIERLSRETTKKFEEVEQPLIWVDEQLRDELSTIFTRIDEILLHVSTWDKPYCN